MTTECSRFHFRFLPQHSQSNQLSDRGVVVAGRWKVTLESGSQWTIRLRWLLVGVENRKTKIEENIKRNGYCIFCLFVEFLLGHFFFFCLFLCCFISDECKNRRAHFFGGQKMLAPSRGHFLWLKRLREANWYL